MKKLLPALLALMLVLSACGPASSTEPEAGDGTVVLVATTYPVYLFTSAVTDGLADYDVRLMVDQPINCLHDYTLTVRDMRILEAADVIIMNGAGLEETMTDALDSMASKPVIDCSAGIELLPAAEDHHHGEDEEEDGHDEGDPHIWMDPVLACQMVDTIARELSLLDPGHADDFARNAESAQKQIAECNEECRTELADVSPREIITFHDGFAYFARAFDLTILKSIEEESGSEASAREIAEVIDLVRSHRLPAVFIEANSSDSTARAIEAECSRQAPFSVGTLTLMMSRDPDHEGIDAYCAGLTANVRAIREVYQ